MKDRFGNEMTAYVVSGRADQPVSSTSQWVLVHLTLVLTSRTEFQKVEVDHRVYPKDRMVQDTQNSTEKQFGEEKWKEMEGLMLKLADGDKTVGKHFFRQALEAYDVRGKLRPDQVEEAVMGALIIEEVSQL